MKICPICEKEYQDDMNFCLEDGSVLKDSFEYNREKTLINPKNIQRPTNQNNAATDAPHDLQTNFGLNERKNQMIQSRKSSFGLIIGSIVLGLSVVSGFLIYGVINRFSAVTSGNNSGEIPNINVKPSPFKTPSNETGKLKIEIQERVKGGFDSQFLKCLVTNVGDNVIKNPSVKLTLYKNDIKIGDVSEDSELKYLKPNQSVPVWIELDDKSAKYTSARIDETVKQDVAKKDANLLFPTLVYTDAKMTNEKRTSLLNFKPYTEIFYIVKGTVENHQSEKVRPQIFILYYDAEDQIVGIASTYPPELEGNEKAEFSAMSGETNMFGVPIRFELIAVDDR
jgi:hypothetical protein